MDTSYYSLTSDVVRFVQTPRMVGVSSIRSEQKRARSSDMSSAATHVNTCPPHRLLTRIGLILSLSVWLAAGVRAAPSDTDRTMAFARVTPDSANILITVRRVAELGVALDRAHAWQLLSLVAGGSGGNIQPINLSEAFAGILGVATRVESEELAGCEVGFAMTPASDLVGSVWFVRLPVGANFGRWFPLSEREASGSTGAVRFARMRSGGMVCVRDRVVAFSRIWGPDTLLEQTTHLLAGRARNALGRSKSFRELAAYLPDDYLGLAFVSAEQGKKSVWQGSPSWWPDMDRAVIGLYEGDGRIDVALRASLRDRLARPKLSRTATERLLSLPQTTLFAAVMSLNLATHHAPDRQPVPTGALARYLGFLGAFEQSRNEPEAGRRRLGPHVVLAWGQDLSDDGSTPQVAIIVECQDRPFVLGRMQQLMEGLARSFQKKSTAREIKPLQIERSRHLGATIHHVPLQEFAERSGLSLMKLLRNMDPAWTVWDGWLILALSPQHVERILDAQFGLTATLATVRDLRPMSANPPTRSLIAIIQADLATKVLDRWLADHQGGESSLLDSVWWDGRSRTRSDASNAFLRGVELVEDPPVLVVSSVADGSPANEWLKQGDRIVGIDGRLLPLSDPKTDLLKRWTTSTAQPGPVLRVQRDDEMIDVVIPKRREPVRPPRLHIDPANAVRELSSLGRTLEFGSFVVDVSDERYYSARLSLRFGKARVSNAVAKPR